MRSTRSSCARRERVLRCRGRRARRRAASRRSACARDAAAEPRSGRLLEPVRLVEDDRVVLRQHAAARGEVREVERVVHDHEVGCAARSRAASAKHAETNGQRRPEQRSGPTASSAQSASVGSTCELGAVAGLGRVEPALHRLPGARRRARRRAGTAGSPGAGGGRGSSRGPSAPRRRTSRPIAAAATGTSFAEQLFLQRLRRGRDDDPLPRLERRDEVGEALADAGAGLGDEVLADRERVLDGARRARPARRRGS